MKFFSPLSLSLSSLVCLAVATLTGCGAGSPGNFTTTPGASSMSGVLYGGPNPISGATITLYVSANNGYGGAATQATTTTSGSDGSFGFTLPSNFTCPAGQYAYITGFGGNPGTGSNNNILLMSVVGPCSTNYGTVNGVPTYIGGHYVYMNEVTTAADAFALSGFLTIDTSGSTPIVNVSAPANNNAATPSTTAASGMAHAFANAQMLMPSGATQPPTTNAAGGAIPSAELLALGNSLFPCVNSTGPTGTNTWNSNDGSACGQLYSFTTPANNHAAVPANTLQAALNLAHFPNPSSTLLWNTSDSGATPCSQSVTSATTNYTNSTATCIFMLGGTTAYPGTMTSAPPDWVIAVRYPQSTAQALCPTTPVTNCSGINYPQYVALDYADNVYVLNNEKSATTYSSLTGLSFDGTPIFTTANDTTNITARLIATDAANHVAMLNTGPTSGTAPNQVVVYNATTGTVLQTILSSATHTSGLAIDPSNNIYMASTDTGVNLRKIPYNGTPATAPYGASATYTNGAPTQGIYQIAFDSLLDFFYTGNAGTGATNPNSSTPATLNYLQNNGTYAAPAYTLTAMKTSAAFSAGFTTNSYGLATDSNNNAWVVDSTGLHKLTRVSGAAPTVGPAIALTQANGAYYNHYIQVDGLNNVITADNANGQVQGGVAVYDSTDAINLGLYKGCFLVGKVCGATATTTPVWGARNATIDSSGDIWIAAATDNALTEFIGAAAPTWPGLSLAKFGRPQ